MLIPNLVIASHNIGKFQEITQFLAPFHSQITSALDLGLTEPEETGTTYVENALLKAKACAEATQLPALGDDSGIEVEALGGQPGLYSARYAYELGGMKGVFEKWATLPEIRTNPQVTFICSLVLAWPDGHFESFEGSVRGQLSFPPRGSHGHGYDPIFIPDGHKCTLAEMTANEKNACSHRYRALQKLINACF